MIPEPAPQHQQSSPPSVQLRQPPISDPDTVDPDTVTQIQARPGRPRRRRPRWRRWLVALAIVLGLALLVDKVITLATSPAPVGQFRTPEGAAEYDAAYAAALATMPTPTRTLDVPTSFGVVRVYEWTSSAVAERTPVLVASGWGSGTPMWNANLPGFLADRPVYAFDALGDAGKSVQRAPITDTAQHGTWLREVLDHVGLDKVHVVGHSFGSATTTALALSHPERVASLTQLEPVLTYDQLPLKVVLWSVPVNIGFLPQSWRDHALARIGGVSVEEVRSNDPVGRMVAAGTRHYRQAMPMPTPLTEQQRARLTMPVYVGVAGRTSLMGNKAAERARQLPNSRVKLWPNATHSLPSQEVEGLRRDLVAFWASAD